MSGDSQIDDVVLELLERWESRSPHCNTTLEEFFAGDPTVAQDSRLLERLAAVVAELGFFERATCESPSLPSIPGYNVTKELGVGGMGRVFLAWHQGLERTVALKFMRTRLSDENAGRSRFEWEGKTAALLGEHPNIVQIYGSGNIGDDPYLVMEYMRGRSLRQKWMGTPQGPKDVASIVLRLAGAVQHAHNQKVIHRDLKPGNILLTTHGEFKISDFGLASNERAERITEPGQLVGTLEYMAPEQLDGESSEKSDVYGLGAILYEGLTGHPPFEGTRRELIKQVSDPHGPIAPRKFHRWIPADLESICLKCLKKDPQERYASAFTLGEDLQRWLDGIPVHARRASLPEKTFKWCRRNPRIAGLIGALTIAILGAAYFGVQQARTATREAKAKEQVLEESQRRRESLLQSADLALGRGITLCDTGEVQAGLLWMARALRFVESAGGGELEDLIRRNLNSWKGQLPPLRAMFRLDGQLSDAILSPNGDFLVTIRFQGPARLWRVDTGEEVAPIAHDHVSAAAFSQDSQELITFARGEFRFFATANAQPTKAPLKAPNYYSADFANDGEHVLVSDYVEDRQLDGPYIVGPQRCQFWSLRGRTPIGPPILYRMGLPPRFSSDGRSVWVASDDTTLANYTLPDLQAPTSTLKHDAKISRFDASKDDPRHVVSFAADKVLVWDADDGSKRTLPTSSLVIHWPMVRPDGQLVALFTDKELVEVWDLNELKKLASFRFESTPASFAFHPTNRQFFSLPSTSQASLQDLETKATFAQHLWLQDEITGVRFADSGDRVIGFDVDGLLCIWDTPADERPGISLPHDAGVNSLAFSSDGDVLLTGSDDKAMRCWKVATGQWASKPSLLEESIYRVTWLSDAGCVTVEGGPANAERSVVSVWPPERDSPLWTQQTDKPVRELFFARDLIIAQTAHQLYVWEAASGKELLATAEAPQGERIVSMACSANGEWVGIGHEHGWVRVYEARTGWKLANEYQHPDGVFTLSFAPNGKALLVGGRDQIALLWDFVDNQFGPSLRHSGTVTCCQMSLDGNIAVTGATDKAARVWDLRSGKLLAEFKLSYWAECLAMDEKQSILATGTVDGQVRIWDLRAGKAIGAPIKFPGTIQQLALHPDGKRLAAASNLFANADPRHGVARIWALPAPILGSAQQVENQMILLTGHRLDANGTVIQVEPADWWPLLTPPVKFRLAPLAER